MASNKDSNVAGDPLVETKLHEVLRKSEISDDYIRNMIIKCSACAKQLNPHSKKLKQHLHLKVLVCEECTDFYNGGEFSQDEDGDKYCRWCGNGGKLFGCDYCTNSFCVPCIHRNFGRGEVREIRDKDWKCYSCKPAKLKQKIAFCDMILEYSKDRSRWQCKKSTYSNTAVVNFSLDSENYLENFFEAAETTCSKFQHKISTLKSLHKGKEKSNKHIFLKLLDVSDSFKNEMKIITKKGHQFSCTLAQKSVKSLENNISVTQKDESKNITNSNRSNSIASSSDDDLVEIPSLTEKATSKDESGDEKQLISVPKENDSNPKNNHIKDKNDSALKNHSDSEQDSISILNTENDSALECTESKVSEETSIKPDGFAALIKSTLFSDNDSSDSSFSLPEITNHDSSSSNKDQQEKDTTELKSAKKEDDCKDEIANNVSSSDIKCPNNKDKQEKDSTKHKSVKEEDECKDEVANNVSSSHIKSPNNEDKQEEDTTEHKSVKEEDDSKGEVANNVSSPHKKSPSDKKEKSSSKGIVLSSDSSSSVSTSSFSHKKSPSDKKEKSSSKGILLSSDSSSSISTDSSDEGKELKLSSVKRKLFRKKTVKSVTPSKSMSMAELLKCPKLKMESYVKLEKMDLSKLTDNSLKLHKRESDISLDSDFDEDLEELKKTVNTLSRLPKAKKTTPFKKEAKAESEIEKSTKQSVQKKSEPKKSKMKDEDEKENDGTASSSAIEFSSSDEEIDIKKAPTATFKKEDPNELAKKSLLEKPESSEESSSSSSSSDIVALPKSKKKVAKKSSNSSSDEFQPRKKTKYEKLLHVPLKASDDDDDEVDEKENKDDKETKNAEKKKRKKRKISSDDEKSSDSSSENNSSSDEKTKKKKKKRKISSDNAKGTDSSSENSSSSDEKKKKQKPKKRRRIKAVSDSSDEGSGGKKGNDDSDVEIIGSQDTPSGKGRKNIRKVLSTKKLADETKEAQMAEKERKRRLQERQKLYNKITDTSEDGTQIITRKMVLEVDPESKEEVVEIHPDVVEKLKPHQINGVKFMWECTIESLKELETKPGSGCILAHCMGLGKTLQVIAFLYTCMTNKLVSKHIKTAMIICPYNTVLNWEKEFETWLEGAEDDILIHQMAVAKDNDTRLAVLKYWDEAGGVLIIGYDIFRRLVEGKMQRFPKKYKEKLFRILTETPDIVVCDEGHILKNETSSISKATSKLKTQRRIVLTGTPLQNNLKEYHCMVQFVKPSLLGNSKEFRNRFVNPITNGQYDDSLQRDVKLMKKRVHILHKLLEGCVQRCDYSTLTKFLPPKHEFVISVRLSEVQIKMYRYYLDKISESKSQGKIEGRTLFSDYNSLKNIWTFPYICHLSHERLEIKRAKQFDSEEEEGFIDDNSYESSSDSSKSVPGSPTPGTKENNEKSSSEDEVVRVYKTRSRATKEGSEEEEEEEEETKSIVNQWYHEFISDEDRYNINLSGKMVLLLDILKECEAIGDKIIVFSQSLLTLNMIEDVLAYMDEKPLTEEDKGRDVIGTWIRGIDYFRMDGATSADFRKKWIELFNNPKNERARLFLISTKAGSLGTNLIGANRVVLLDASWNPSHDVQAIFRVYRFGQTKPVYIYRLLAQGTMEEKIYDRQVTKLSLSIRVVDEQQIDRHFNAAQLAELYNFEPDSKSDRPTPIVPRDRLLAEMLIRNTHWIVNYHEHDSLLQNSAEEDLTEEERQSAWNEYENEKEGLFNNIADANPLSQEIYEQLNVEPTQDFVEEVTLPSMDDVLKVILEKIQALYPNADLNEKRQRLLDGLRTLRQMYQAKHVHILRLKQEYFSRGIVRIPMNKYLDDLAKIMNALSLNISTLHGQIEKAKKLAFQQAYQQAQARMAASQNAMPNMYQQYQNRMPGNPQYYFNRGAGQHPQYPQNVYQGAPFNMGSFPGYAPMASGRGARMYATNNRSTVESRPVITEVEDSTPDSTTNVGATNAGQSSSVVITEIE